MSVAFIKGNLLDSDCDYICHQVNCQGVMGSGVAKQIYEKWPQVYKEYLLAGREQDIGYGDKQLSWGYMLGHIQVVPISDSQSVINMFAQENYGYDGKQYTSYEAFSSCLQEILLNCKHGSTIAFPFKIGCDRGGADWGVIYHMIVKVLSDEMEVFFYEI